MSIQIDKHIVSMFQNIWDKAKQNSPLKQKSAVCIATLDEAGFPQSRYVDLKAVDEAGFTFCTAYDSDKGRHINANNKVSLTAWWDHIGYQVRVVGTAEKIADELADRYWLTRSHEAQVATSFFQQSGHWNDSKDMKSAYDLALKDTPEFIARPDNWGGYMISPISIEFLQFKTNRVHIRERYQLDEHGWNKTLLQP